MAHTDFIEIGKGHYHLHIRIFKILIGDIPFLSHIASGAFHSVQKPFNGDTLIFFHC